MSERISKYKFSAPHVFQGEIMITYKNGYLYQMENLRNIGNRWDDMCINKAIPFKESQIPAVREEHANLIYFKAVRNRPVGRPELSDVRVNDML
jgi:hypothetical protein